MAQTCRGCVEILQSVYDSVTFGMKVSTKLWILSKASCVSLRLAFASGCIPLHHLLVPPKPESQPSRHGNPSRLFNGICKLLSFAYTTFPIILQLATLRNLFLEEMQAENKLFEILVYYSIRFMWHVAEIVRRSTYWAVSEKTLQLLTNIRLQQMAFDNQEQQASVRTRRRTSFVTLALIICSFVLLCGRAAFGAMSDAGLAVRRGIQPDVVVGIFLLHAFWLPSMLFSVGLIGVAGEQLLEFYKMIVEELELVEGTLKPAEEEEARLRFKRLQECFDLYTKVVGYPVVVNLLECSIVGLAYAYKSFVWQQDVDMNQYGYSPWRNEIGTVGQLLGIFLIAHVGQSMKSDVTANLQLQCY